VRALSTLFAAALVGCAAEAPPPLPEPPPPPPVVVAPPAPLPPVHVQVLALNDFHGNLEPPHGHDGTVHAGPGVDIPAGGAAYLVAHVQRLRATNPNTVVVSAGDLTGASPLVSNLFDDEPTVLVMNRLGLDLEGVGNHDFDRGLPELLRLQHGGPQSPVVGLPVTSSERPFPGATYQYLAANVLGPDGKPVFAPYAIKEFGGVKVAFIGMTLEATPTVTTKKAILGLTFANEAATANALLPELRKQGVATTVLLIHQGGFQEPGGTYDSCEGLTGDIEPVLAALDPAFRVVVTAHTHQAYDCTIGDRHVTSAGSYGRLVTVIDLAIDPAKGELVDVHARNVPVTRDIEPDAEVVKLVRDYEAKARPITERIVGYQDGPFTRDPRAAHSASCETPLGDLIADGQLAATRGAGAVIALMNPGGVRTDLAPAAGTTGPQPIRYDAAFEIQPFGNRLVTLTITGGQLHDILLKQFGRDRPRVLSVSQGFTYRYAYDPATKGITLDATSMRLHGQVIDPHRRYRVTVNSFLADGGDGFSALHDAKDRVDGVLDVEAFVTHLGKSSAHAPLVPPKALTRVVGNGCQ
jgi:5'-nucleotidase